LMHKSLSKQLFLAFRDLVWGLAVWPIAKALQAVIRGLEYLIKRQERIA